MNTRQERAMNRILYYYKTYVVGHHPEVYQITHEVKPLSEASKTLSMTVRVKRIDCEPYSPRAVLCGDGGHFFIGPRGKVEVVSTYRVGDSGEREKQALKHIALMVRGHTRK